MKEIRAAANAVLLLVLLSGIAQAQSAGPGAPTPQSPSSPSTTSLQYNALYASADSDLWLINPVDGSSSLIGPIGFDGTDIAFLGQSLYGVSFSDLLSIDPTTGIGTVIGSTGYSDVNALTIGLDGVMYAATASGEFMTLDPATGEGHLIGNFGFDMGSSGDLAYRKDNKMFASIQRGEYSNTWLAVVDMVNGTATLIGDVGYPNVFGLSFKDDVLYGVTDDGEILRIDTSTGAGTSIGTSNASFWGLSTSGQQLTGSLTSPLDNSTSGLATMLITANASYPNGPGVKQVEFYVFFDDDWHSLGADTTAPYTANWAMPDGLKTQQVQFRIDVVGTDSYRNNYAGGVRRVNVLAGAGNPAVTENWVPTRAYLNQRSLSPNGDWKCNVSSIAMVLAMEGYIGLDYQSMAEEANQLYPMVAPNDSASVDTEFAGLHSQADDAVRLSVSSNDDAWTQLKALIDAGHPVIVNSLPGLATSAGHFVVGVGYHEEGDTHDLITYDPFGEWRGATNSYYYNVTGDPLSHVGKWVYYDFKKLTGNHVYLFAAHGVSALSQPASGTPSTAPDQTSDEPRVAGTFDGFAQGPWPQIFAPFIMMQ